MTDRPILFSAPMVRALIEGRKTQTRRVINPLPSQVKHWSASFNECPSATIGTSPDYDERWVQFEHPKGGPYTARPLRPDIGDRLWVRESYYHRGHWEPVPGAATKQGRQKWAFIPADDVLLFDAPEIYRLGRHSADPATVAWHKRLGRFMPRWASRMTLDVTEVHVERLQDISEADAIAEGAEAFDLQCDERLSNADRIGLHGIMSHRRGYERLWNSINGDGAWEANPWLMAISFNVRLGNIDQEAR